MRSLGVAPSNAADLVTKAYVDGLSFGGGGSQQVFVQQADPGGTGPAIWYVTDGSGNIIGKRVRL